MSEIGRRRERRARGSVLEPRADRLEPDSSLLRTMVLDKEEDRMLFPRVTLSQHLSLARLPARGSENKKELPMLQSMKQDGVLACLMHLPHLGRIRRKKWGKGRLPRLQAVQRMMTAVADLLVLAEGCRVPVLPALARGRLLALRPYRISLEAESSLLAVNSALKGVPMLSVQPKGKQKGCAGCNRKIKDRYLLKALDKYWHEDCLKCACCDCRLGEVGSTLYTKANLILCRRDYLSNKASLVRRGVDFQLTPGSQVAEPHA
ncbi:hypothetical protein DNTS_003492 [Danionella cerebrum]|uniref:LIM zinc-binding domain-containing protein n=1 Tax=Danionella cerebrum TaxID=2873325 RepID=A0A553QT89_9TELE|nr:hypothetical protein DNTS_003492 [Danionella translucida]